MRVTLHKQVVVSDHLAFDAEREVVLPMPPFAGMRLYGIECDSIGEAEDVIDAIGCDLPTGRVSCYLPVDDLRPEFSVGVWTEEEIRERYQDWVLTPDEFDVE
jgi:hypothetical protein